MTNPLVFTPKCLVLPHGFHTGPSKLFEFSRNCEAFPTVGERQSGGTARTRTNAAYVSIRQHTAERERAATQHELTRTAPTRSWSLLAYHGQVMYSPFFFARYQALLQSLGVLASGIPGGAQFTCFVSAKVQNTDT
jgi:hypothetical protein